MVPTLTELMIKAGTWADEQIQQQAALELMLFLESKNRPIHSDDTFYSDVLPEHLRSLPLTDHEQAEVLAELQRLIVAAPTESARVALLSALSASAPWLAITEVLQILEVARSQFAHGEVRQVLVALDNMLDVFTLPDAHPSYRQVDTVRRALQERSPVPVLDDMARTADPEIAAFARTLRERFVHVMSAGE